MSAISDHAAFRVPVRSTRRDSQALAHDVPDRLVVWTMITLLVASVVLQNVMIPFGSAVLFFDIVPLYIALGILVFFGRLTLSPTRLILFLLAFGCAIVQQVGFVRGASLSSMFLAMLIYASYVGVVKASQATYMRILALFQYVVLGIVALVFLDIAVQLVNIDMPSIHQVKLPESILNQTYVYIQPIIYGSRIMKPNAFFMLEASFTSQFIAIGLVIELGIFRRWQMVAVMAVGLIATFATTGILLVALSAPFLLGRHWAKAAIVGIVVLPLLIGGAIVSGWAEVQMARMNSVDRQASSFSQRFVIPYTAMWDLATTGSESDIINGYGAGATTRLMEIAEYNSISRAFVEYGLLFFVAFMIYINYCFLFTGVPFIVMYVTLMNYHFMSGNFHLPSTVNYCFVLVTGYALRRQDGPNRRKPVLAPVASTPERLIWRTNAITRTNTAQ